VDVKPCSLTDADDLECSLQVGQPGVNALALFETGVGVE